MKNLRQYFAERFPIGLTATHAFATSAMLVGIAALNRPIYERIWSATAITITFFFFMLRMRVTDEFKDRSHDNRNYPNRPVQRGIITTRQLISIGIIALTTELGFAFAAGVSTGHPIAIIWHLSILGYSVLTHFEFFAKAFLERHFNFYFLIHQLIFILYPVWVFSIWNTEINPKSLAGAIAFVGFMSAMEIVRKYEIRRDPAGEIVMDTYLGVWKAGAFWAMFAITAIGGWLIHFAGGNLLHTVISLAICLMLIAVRQKTDQVRALVALGFILQSVVILIWG